MMHAETRDYVDFGEFLDKCADSTIIDVDFLNDDGVRRVPLELADRPTAAELRGNQYLRGLRPFRYRRFTDLKLPKMTGWCVSVDDLFDGAAFAA
ncbi:hypothetical protein AALA48_08640 [Bifidobacterium pseudolongum]|jgi:hypothetical protein|uniref:hypothetical protein n=1 Tax=Bifidobacterium pseudolongum TaxID=1694 RepID=UPI003513060B